MEDVRKLRVLTVVDMLLSYVIFTPLNLIYWWSTWTLMDVYLGPGNLAVSAWASLAIGAALEILLHFIQCPLHNWTRKIHPITRHAMVLVFLYVFAFAGVNHWRGVWYICDHYSGITWNSGLVSYGTSVICLMLLRSLNVIQAPPTMISLDVEPDVFLSTTRFCTKIEVRLRHIADTLFTILVIHSLCPSAWRGIWELVDLGLYPDNPYYSAYASLAIGAILTLLAYVYQYVGSLKSINGTTNFSRLSFDHSLTLLAHLAAVMSWRAWWMLFSLYITPSHLGLTVFMGHLTGFLSLALLLASNSIAPRGVRLDGGQNGTESFLLPLDYTRYFLRNGYRLSQVSVNGHVSNTQTSYEMAELD